MILSQHLQHVVAKLDALYDSFAQATPGWPMGCAKDEDFEPEDGGVPTEMMDGEVDDGWVKWKLLPSTVTEEQVVELEREIGHEFPPLYRAYLVSKFHLFSSLRD